MVCQKGGFEITQNKAPLVTIALPVYNGAATLGLAIHSILQQSFNNWELIILNDASTDSSLEVMRSFDDPRIRLVEGENNMGLSARLNLAIDMACGKYFARMDQDDVSFPDRLEKQIQFFETHPDVDLLATATLLFGDDGEALGVLPVRFFHAQICARPWQGFPLPHPTWMGRIEWFRQHRYQPFSDGVEDQHLLYRSHEESTFACLPEPLLAYREARGFRKMFRARRRFLRCIGREAIRQKKYSDLIKLLFMQILKAMGDFLRHFFGANSLRNSLKPADKQTQEVWVRLLKTVQAVSERDEK